MRFRDLRKILLGAVLAALPACSGSPPVPCGGPVTNSHYDVTVSKPSPSLQFHIESCRLDADACPDLCNAVVQSSNVSGSVTKCEISFDAQNTYASIDTTSGGPCFAQGGAAGGGR